MKNYKFKANSKDEEDFEIEDSAFLLITAIDNLTKELERGRTNG